MKLLEICQNYTVRFNEGDDTYPVTVYSDKVDGKDAVIVWVEETGTQMTFEPDAEVTFHEKGEFSVLSEEGGEATKFIAMQRVKWNTNPNPGPRDINIEDIRLEVTEPNRLWLKVGKFDVLLNHTDEGIVVDVWPFVGEDIGSMPAEPLASCYAFDSDADAFIESREDDAD